MSVQMRSRAFTRFPTMNDSWSTILAIIFVILGASTQRITGMGFALVCAPALVHVFGPLTAVTLANTVGIGLNVTVLALTFRHLNWRKGAMIGAGAALVIPPLSVLLRNASTAWLQITIGVIVVIAVSSILLRRQRASPASDTVVGRIATGVAAGAMGATAGLSGPPLAMYAARTDWRGDEFVATFQMIGIVISILSISTAPALNIPARAWFLIIGAIVVGLGVGSVIAPRVNSKHVQTATLIISAIGGALTCIAGLRELL